jgi:hypothetical protein
MIENYVSVVLSLPNLNLIGVDTVLSNATVYITSMSVCNTLLDYSATSENNELAEDILVHFKSGHRPGSIYKRQGFT